MCILCTGLFLSFRPASRGDAASNRCPSLYPMGVMLLLCTVYCCGGVGSNEPLSFTHSISWERQRMLAVFHYHDWHYLIINMINLGATLIHISMARMDVTSSRGFMYQFGFLLRYWGRYVYTQGVLVGWFEHGRINPIVWGGKCSWQLYAILHALLLPIARFSCCYYQKSLHGGIWSGEVLVPGTICTQGKDSSCSLCLELF